MPPGVAGDDLPFEFRFFIDCHSIVCLSLQGVGGDKCFDKGQLKV